MIRSRFIEQALSSVLGTAVMLGAAPPASASTHVSHVTIDPARAGAALPSTFLGLSFEQRDLPSIAGMATRGTVVARLRSVGPGVLRFGGSSVDTDTVYLRNGQAKPDWAQVVVRPADLTRLADLSRRTGWRVLLSVDLAHYDPQRAARLARDASRRLGGSLAGIEIGNEANVFGVFRQRPEGWAYADFLREVRVYIRAMRAAAPGVRIAGPDATSLTALQFASRFARDVAPAMITAHYYPLEDCYSAPTLADLLADSTARRDARTAREYARIQRTSHIPVRFGETNNIACSGRPGVSDTFGAALWATGYMLTLARAGITGVNLHTLPRQCESYTPLCAADGSDIGAARLRPTPEWHALVLMHSLRGDRFIHRVARPSLPGVSVDALRGPRNAYEDVVIVNRRIDRDAHVSVRLARGGSVAGARIRRLRGPAITSTNGITFGAGTPLAPRSGAVSAKLPPGQAAVIRLSPRTSRRR